LLPEPKLSPVEVEDPPNDPTSDLVRVRKELDLLATRRLRKALTDRDSRRWDELIRMEQHLLGAGREPAPGGPAH
jgi:hypothetical protein